MKKKKYDWQKRCLSLICVLVLISMIILQSVPVTYASDNNVALQGTDADVFTSEPEEDSQMISTTETQPDEEPSNNIPGENISDITSDNESGNGEQGNSDNSVDVPSQPEQGTDSNFNTDQNSGLTDAQDIANEIQSGENPEAPEGEQPNTESHANPVQENEDIWRNSIASAVLSNDYAKDLVAIARTQLGVQENRDNFITTAEGVNHYYSRYGQWAGDAYEEWSVAFINFCIHYANIPQQYLPKSETPAQWTNILANMYGLVKEDYSPKEGDLVFLLTNEHAEGNSQIQTETPAHAGIVTGADEQTLYTIEGNCNGMVQEETYAINSDNIYGYLDMNQVKKLAGVLQEEPQPSEEITPTPGESQPLEEITPTPEESQPSEEVTPTPDESQPSEEVTPTPEEPQPTETPAPESAMQYEDENVIIQVEAEPGVIPEGSTLSVTPIISDKSDADKQAQYDEVADKLAEKAEKEDYELAGFLAYDISFIDVDGNETEPSGNVKVSMNYKKSQAPADIETDENTELKVMHLEEDASGEVQQVTDLSDEQVTGGSVDTIEANDEQEVEQVEFSSDSFSTFAITWVNSKSYREYLNLTIHYMDEKGNEISGFQKDNVQMNDNETVFFSGYAQEIPGYEYIAARIDDNEKGAYVNSVTAEASGDYWGTRTRICLFKNTSETVKKLEINNFGSSPQTADVYLIYRSISYSDTQATLSHGKYIRKNTDNTYDITLNASGTVGSENRKKKLDIVLLMDISGSMQGIKLTNAKNAVRSLTNELNTRSDSIDARYKLVTFSSNANIMTSNWIWGSDLYTIVNGLNADGATNYDDGLSKTATAIGNARSDADKIVIFLTDGEPTYYNSEDDGYAGPGNRANENTYKAALTSAELITCDRFMAIGISLGRINWEYGSSFTDRPSTGQQLLQKVTDATNAAVKDTAVDLKSSAELPQKFKDIAADILTFVCKNVTITDTLSQYVDTTDNSKIQLKTARRSGVVYTQTGDTVEISLTDPELLSGSGKNVTVGGEVLGTLHYNSENRTVTWSLGADYELKQDLYYYLCITNVEPNQTAETTFVENGKNYGNSRGDNNTDAGTDGFYATSGGTSSGKPGFPSNSMATVTYTETKTNKTTTETYAVPVVQIDLTKIYRLPDSGASGIYMFTISGVAVMAAALLLFINNKRKEDKRGTEQ